MSKRNDCLVPTENGEPETKRGQVFIVSGPSGSGKSTLLREVFARRDNLFFSVSATTRAPREGETDGVEYFFLTREAFEKLIEEDTLLEHAEYAGNYYGTPLRPVEEKLEAGCDVVMDIEVQGAAQVKTKMPEAISIFIMPPSLEILENRLRSRGTDSEEKILKRLDTAKREMLLAPNYDHIVINDTIERASAELWDLMTADNN